MKFEGENSMYQIGPRTFLYFGHFRVKSHNSSYLHVKSSSNVLKTELEFFNLVWAVFAFGKMKNFVVDATVLPHILNKNVHILCKIRPKVALESVFKNCDITEKWNGLPNTNVLLL